MLGYQQVSFSMKWKEDKIMSYVYLGKIVSTHGIKGELRILSDFEYKSHVFKKGFNIYIGEEKQKETIETYRHHKQFEMITLNSYNNINEVLHFLKKNVYILKEDLNLSSKEYLLEELIHSEVIENQEMVGKIVEIVYNKANILLKVSNLEGKMFYIPHNDYFIKNVDIRKKQIEVQNIRGLIE